MKRRRFALAAALVAAFGGDISSQTASSRPVLLSSTFWGGSAGERSAVVAVDAAGNVYVAGTTGSPDFPKTVNTLPARGPALGMLPVAKYRCEETILPAPARVFVFSDGTFEIGRPDGTTVVGYTTSTDLPVVNPIHPAFHMGFCGEFGSICADGFVSKIDPTGQALLFSSYLGTVNDDRLSDVAVDALGNIYVIGTTEGNVFDGATPLRPFAGGQSDVEVEGGTVGAALHALTERYPDLRRHLYSDDGKLRAFVNVYVNDEDIRYLEKENTPLGAGDSISIVPSIAGGAR